MVSACLFAVYMFLGSRLKLVCLWDACLILLRCLRSLWFCFGRVHSVFPRHRRKAGGTGRGRLGAAGRHRGVWLQHSRPLHTGIRIRQGR